MNIHWIQHVEFEGLGCIEPWLVAQGHPVKCSRLWAGDEFPNIGLSAEASAKAENVDGLIVMGGPMGITDHDDFPWLVPEKEFIKAVIDQNKPVLGICLGAQLIADCLGSKVWKGQQKEIGFYECRACVPLALNDRDGRSTFFPEQFVPFHWHGDTFGIPEGAVRLASSEATQNQAFLYKDNVLALQFHLETTEESLLKLYENCPDEITDAPFIQTLENMRPFFPMLGKCNELMKTLLEKLFG